MVELLFIASYYRQLFTKFKMKKNLIKTSFVIHEGPKAKADKNGIDFMIFYFNISGKLSVILCYT